MKRILTFLTTLVLLSVATAAAASDEQILTQMLNEFLAGASVNDIAAHERFWDDDLVYTSSGGLRFGKQEILESMSVDAAAFPEEPAVVYSAEDIRVRLYGDTAVVAFRLRATAPGDSQEDMAYFNTGTFVKRDDQWRAVAWQATRIPAAE